MLTAAGCQARRQRLFERLDPRPDLVLISDPQHLVYFANFWMSPFVFRSTNACALLILGAEGSSCLIADNQLRGFAESAFVDEVVAPVWYRGQESADPRGDVLVRAALERLRQIGGAHVGYETARTPPGVIEGLRSARGQVRPMPIDATLHSMKRSKDPDEVSLLRRSMRAAEAGHAAALHHTVPGMTELELFLLVQDAALRDVGDTALVYGDFVSGPRCEQGGGPPSLRRIERGDLVLLDFSVVIHGYRCDFANTFACGSPPTDRQRQLYEACVTALADAEPLLAPGRSAREIDEAVRRSFQSRGLRETFTSHSGHGIGLGHPDPPYLTPESTDVLMAGDVVAVEPGQYVTGVAGMRYERNYLITSGGYEILSHHELTIEQP